MPARATRQNHRPARPAEDVIATIPGTPGNDTLNGTAEADTITGLAGNDTIRATGGEDQVDGGDGRERFQAGPEADRFRYLDRRDAPASFTAGPGEPSTDETITGFDGASGDRIDLRTIDADPGRDGDQAFRFVGTETVDQPDEVGIVTFDAAV